MTEHRSSLEVAWATRLADGELDSVLHWAGLIVQMCHSFAHDCWMGWSLAREPTALSTWSYVTGGETFLRDTMFHLCREETESGQDNRGGHWLGRAVERWEVIVISIIQDLRISYPYASAGIAGSRKLRLRETGQVWEGHWCILHHRYHISTAALGSRRGCGVARPP